MAKQRISGWGRQFVEAFEWAPEDLRAAPLVLFRGLGRSYGDSSLPPASNPRVVRTTRANRVLSFDGATGALHAEAGLSLYDLNRISLPRGYFIPVTPGTEQVTLGGMVAADIHGKNHHQAGCLGSHVTRLTMRVADGRVLSCSPTEERELFLATVGGMGLTGQILEVELPLQRIPSPWILQESERVPDVDTYVEKLAEAAHQWPMTVGWIDCLTRGAGMGRGILMKGRWAQPEEAPATFPGELPQLALPFQAPELALNPLTVRAFNTAYFHRHPVEKKVEVVSPFTFFYPLDFVHDWNKGYGPRGLTQYQCVLPTSAGQGAARRFLDRLTSLGGASFLCVIKDCGPESPAYLSFPKPGISVALDIPVRDQTQALVDALNEHVLGEGGRIYLAKDGFTRPEHFRAMEPRLPRFLEVRERWDPQHLFRSAQSARLFGDA